MTSRNRLCNQFTDKKQVDESRALRVWQYYSVIVIGWGFFSLYFHFRGHHDAVRVAIVSFIGFIAHYLVFRHADCSNRRTAAFITHSYIGISAVGVFLMALSATELQACLLFFPVGMTIACMLLGIRESIPWLLAGIVAFVTHAALVHGISKSLTSPIIDRTILNIGASVVHFFCLRQFEAFYSRRAADLVTLSHELNQLATTDFLTGLANRFQFRAELENHVAHALANGETLALLVLDMDGFKEVNDTYGHGVGDEALVEIASRLKQNVDSQAVVARLGGDEFCVLLRDVKSREPVTSLCQTLHNRLSGQYHLGNVTCNMGTSIGISFCPDDAQAPEELIAYADTAMFDAKENHRPFSFYYAELTTRIVEYKAVQERLSQALELNQFFLVYQPQLDIKTGEIVGAEALLRWRHDGNVIPPLQFIPLLESSRKIIQVSRWILDTVCAQIKQWNDEGLRLKIAVNISAIDFHDPGFCDVVTDAIQRNQVNANQLELEITEGVLIEDLDDVATKLDRLKQMGFTISIDDFGTGYSSLAYIRQLPIDKIKIDREFVKGVPDTDDGTIASTMILMAESLELEVVAEGVETESQRHYFSVNGCHQYQGFLASPPISPDDLMDLVIKTNGVENNRVKTNGVEEQDVLTAGY